MTFVSYSIIEEDGSLHMARADVDKEIKTMADVAAVEELLSKTKAEGKPVRVISYQDMNPPKPEPKPEPKAEPKVEPKADKCGPDCHCHDKDEFPFGDFRLRPPKAKDIDAYVGAMVMDAAEKVGDFFSGMSNLLTGNRK